jgi:hypothetical protein
MSDICKVYRNFLKYKGSDDAEIYFSTAKGKKFAVITPEGKVVNFGQKGYTDYTRHQDEKRRRAYLARATKIKGDWASDKYSPNSLSISILWQ